MSNKEGEISASSDAKENQNTDPENKEKQQALDVLKKEELQLSTSIIETKLKEVSGTLFEKIKTNNNYPQFLEFFKQAIHQNKGKIFLDEYILGGCWEHFLSLKEEHKGDADIVAILAESIKPGNETSHDLNNEEAKKMTQTNLESSEALSADSSFLGMFKNTPAYKSLESAFKSPEKVDGFLSQVSNFTQEKFKEQYPTLSTESVKNINDGALLVFLERFGKLNAEEQKGFLEGVSKLSQAQTLQYLRTSISGQGWEKVENFFKDKSKTEQKTLTPLQDLGARLTIVEQIVTTNKEKVGDGDGTSAFSHPLEIKKLIENPNLLSIDTQKPLEDNVLTQLLGERKQLTPEQQQEKQKEQQKQMLQMLNSVTIHNAQDFVTSIEKISNKNFNEKQRQIVEKILSQSASVAMGVQMMEVIKRMRPDGGKEFFGGILQFFGFKGGRDAIEGAHYKHSYEALSPASKDGVNNVVSAFVQFSKDKEVTVGLANYAEGLEFKLPSQQGIINKVDVNILTSALMELPAAARNPEILKKSAGAAGIDPADFDQEDKKAEVVKAYINTIWIPDRAKSIPTIDAFSSPNTIVQHAAMVAVGGEMGGKHFTFNKPIFKPANTTFTQKEIGTALAITEKKEEKEAEKEEEKANEKKNEEKANESEKYDENIEYNGTERFDKRLAETQNTRMKDPLYRKKFIDKLIQVSKDLKIHPDRLANVIDLESANTFSSSVRNGIGATGLIQFLNESAKGLGTTTDKLGIMNELEQLDRVKKYFEYWKKTPKSLEQLYLLTLYPAAVDKASSPEAVVFAKGSREYSQNSGFDRNKDGQIQVSEITAKLKEVSGGQTYISSEGNEKNKEKVEIYAKSTEEFRGIGDSTMGPITTKFNQMQNYDGYTTEELLSIIKKVPGSELKSKKIKSALLMGGTNDINKGKKNEDIINNFIKMASYLETNKIQPVLTTLIRKDNNKDFIEKTKALNEKIRALAKENNRALIDFEKEDQKNPIALTDGIHPTYVGSNNGGEQLANHIKKESGIA